MLDSNKFFSRKMLFIMLLGFASGLPLALSGNMLQLWYHEEGLDIKTIGLLALVGQPYAYKFLWSPNFDRYRLPYLTRRRGWLITIQVVLISTLIAMACMSPKETPFALAMLALILSFSSASQDIVIDAFRAELLEASERGLASAWTNAGYRIAMILSGGVGLILAEVLGFPVVYLLMAVYMTLSLLICLATKEKEDTSVQNFIAEKSLYEMYWLPFVEFLTRYKKVEIVLLLLLILIYKMGDAFAFSLSSVFLRGGLGFSLSEIGTVNKIMAISASIAGSFCAGAIMMRISLFNALFYFGWLQCLSNFSFMFLAYVGKVYSVMVATIFIDYFCSGLGTAAFLALLMGLCNKKYTATQYALFSSLSAVGRIYVPACAGFMVDAIGWYNFFFSTVFIAVPGVLLIIPLRRVINSVESENNK